MPSVLSTQDNSIKFLTRGKEVWHKGHRAFIQGAASVINGQVHDYIIKQGRRIFNCPASDLSSQRPK